MIDLAGRVTTLLDQPHVRIAVGDCFDVLSVLPDHSVHAVVTDPPYSPLEYAPEHVEKLRARVGGVWRQPPTLDGVTRRPLPRFTVLGTRELAALAAASGRLAKELLRVCVPGAHVVVASQPLLVDVVVGAMRGAGLEPRGTIVRLVRTLRGGDRPKGAEGEFAGVSVMARSEHEPWAMLRVPLSESTVAANLRRWGTGGLRRASVERPFGDVIESAPARGAERSASAHPSLKPQAFLRAVARAVVPVDLDGGAVVLDPYAGSGSTLAACAALGVGALGIERDPEFAAALPGSFTKLREIRT